MPPGTILRHRSSQKRIYVERAEYFVTSVTHDRYPYFSIPIFADLFVLDLSFGRTINWYQLFGYAVLPEHVHLLFQPLGKANYSDVMGSLKRNVARDINDLVRGRPFVRNLVGDDDSNRRLRRNFYLTAEKKPHLPYTLYEDHFSRLDALCQRFAQTHTQSLDLPGFRWQKSFHDQIIRGRRDFDRHIDYIYSNAVKHNLVNEPRAWPWMWVIGMPTPSLIDQSGKS